MVYRGLYLTLVLPVPLIVILLRPLQMPTLASPGSNDAPRLVNPCHDATSEYAKMPFCDATLPYDARIDDMIKRTTLEEKISNLGTGAGAIKGLGIPAYNWWSEATHGVASVKNDATLPHESNFAFPITTGMSFNRSLWWATGQAIGREARAFMNAGLAYSTYWAPVVNLAREPRWGRNLETPGEDPYLSGEYATGFVKGFQESEDDPYHLQASACCKHYVANEMDASSVDGYSSDRVHFDAKISQQDLMDSYMVPFQACVEKGKVSSLMCSYNAVNGVPSCANDWLLTDVARNNWGFDGYITSDCDADNNVFSTHHYTKTPEESVRDVLRAGTDVDCGNFVPQHAQSALDKGLITEDDIDARLRYLFKMRLRLNHFDPVGPLDKIPASVVCSDEHKAIAREGPLQSASLLKNEGGTLPLDASKIKTAAVIGPNANLSKSVAGYYAGGNPCDGIFFNMVDAVQQYVPHTTTALGIPDTLSSDTSKVQEAATMAAAADAVVLVLGTELSAAREGHDSTFIDLPAGQQALVDAVTKAAKAPITVVTLTAVPLDISTLLSNPKVGAVMHAGLVSTQTLGVGDLLFGKRTPAGRTIQTNYPKEYADEVSIFDFNMRPGPSAWPRPDCPAPYKDCKMGTNPGRTHRFYTGKAVVPFGFGLSYTTFKYDVVSSPAAVDLAPLRGLLAGSAEFLSTEAVAAAGAAATYQVKVTNTGSMDADDVVLGFLTPPGAGQNGVPLQTLFAFERVHVKAGQSVDVFLYPSFDNFAQVDLQGKRNVHPGEYKVHFGVQSTLEHGMGYTEHTFTAA